MKKKSMKSGTRVDRSTRIYLVESEWIRCLIDMIQSRGTSCRESGSGSSFPPIEDWNQHSISIQFQSEKTGINSRLKSGPRRQHLCCILVDGLNFVSECSLFMLLKNRYIEMW